MSRKQDKGGGKEGSKGMSKSQNAEGNRWYSAGKKKSVKGKHNTDE